jgi:hypothetical protein
VAPADRAHPVRWLTYRGLERQKISSRSGLEGRIERSQPRAPRT